MKILQKIYEKTNWKLLIISSVLFVLFMGVVLPYVSYWTEEVKGLPAGPDTLFTLDVLRYYTIRSNFGEEGRKLYIILRWTFDIIWPLVYTFFYFTAISCLAKKSKDKFGYKWLFIPLFAVGLDLMENIIATIFMATDPLQSDFVVILLMISSFAKWVFVGLSFIAIIYLAVRVFIKKGKKNEE